MGRLLHDLIRQTDFTIFVFCCGPAKAERHQARAGPAFPLPTAFAPVGAAETLHRQTREVSASGPNGSNGLCPRRAIHPAPNSRTTARVLLLRRPTTFPRRERVRCRSLRVTAIPAGSRPWPP